MALLTDYAGRYTEMTRLYHEASELSGDERITTFQKALDVYESLDRDVMNDIERYQGVIYPRKSLHRGVMRRWLARLKAAAGAEAPPQQQEPELDDEALR